MMVANTEIYNMLQQMNQDAQFTYSKCKARIEVGYDDRRSNDMAGALGRSYVFVELMDNLLTVRDETSAIGGLIDVIPFIDQLQLTADETGKMMEQSDICFFAVWGRLEAYNAVIIILSAWTESDIIL